MKNFSSDFPVLSQYTYVDTPGSGLLSEGLMEWRQEHDIDFLIGGSIFRITQLQFLNEVRADVAAFMNSALEHTVLLPNFSFGLNTLMCGLDKVKRILLLEGDYPSVNWPFLARGYEVMYVKVDEHLEEHIDKAVAEFKPDIFAFSIVQYIDGIMIDLDFLNDLKQRYPELLLVADGTQFLGTQPFDFAASKIDVLGSSGYKWLLAGYGNGFMVFKDEIAQRVFSTSFPFEPQKEDFMINKTHLMNHFEPGHFDTLNFGSLQYALKYLQQTGLDAIQEHIAELAQYMGENLAELGLLSEAVVRRKGYSPIFNIKGGKKEFDALRSRDIITTMRGNGIRMGVHFYNTRKDIDKVLGVVKHLKS